MASLNAALCEAQGRGEDKQAELELMKEQLTETQEQNHHLTHVVSVLHACTHTDHPFDVVSLWSCQ